MHPCAGLRFLLHNPSWGKPHLFILNRKTDTYKNSIQGKRTQTQRKVFAWIQPTTFLFMRHLWWQFHHGAWNTLFHFLQWPFPQNFDFHKSVPYVRYMQPKSFFSLWMWIGLTWTFDICFLSPYHSGVPLQSGLPQICLAVGWDSHRWQQPEHYQTQHTAWVGQPATAAHSRSLMHWNPVAWQDMHIQAQRNKLGCVKEEERRYMRMLLQSWKIISAWLHSLVITFNSAAMSFCHHNNLISQYGTDLFY